MYKISLSCWSNPNRTGPRPRSKVRSVCWSRARGGKWVDTWYCRWCMEWLQWRCIASKNCSFSCSLSLKGFIRQYVIKWLFITLYLLSALDSSIIPSLFSFSGSFCLESWWRPLPWTTLWRRRLLFHRQLQCHAVIEPLSLLPIEAVFLHVLSYRKGPWPVTSSQ